MHEFSSISPLSDADAEAWEQYLAGEFPVAAAREVESWIAGNEGARRRLQGMAAVFAQWRQDARPHTEPAALLAAVHRRIEAQDMANPPATRSKPAPGTPPLRLPFQRSVSHRWMTRITVMASVIGALGLGVWYAVPHLDSNTGLPDHEYRTRRGEQMSVTLADGSQAVLAPDTRMQLTVRADGQRTVVLEGQAYFTVTHDPDRPFSIQTGTTYTRVLGTSFAVRAYATDRAVEVAVAQGKVALDGGAGATVLLGGDVGRVVPGQMAQVTRDVTIADAFGWMRGQITFDMVPLRDVVTELQRLYDLEITITNRALASQPVTLTFTGESVDAVLGTIARVTDARYTRHGHRVTLSAQ